jgi:hypothetical protein
VTPIPLRGTFAQFARALVTAALLGTPAAAQDVRKPTLDAVVRRADRTGLILVFSSELNDPTVAVPTADYRLVDLTRGTRLPLDSASDLKPPRCPLGSGEVVPENRICLSIIRARSGLPLLDASTYALYTDTVFLKGEAKVDTLLPQLVLVPPVRGAVVAPPETRRDLIGIAYALDLSDRADVTPVISVNGASVGIVTPTTPGRPRCYRVQTMSFLCEIQRELRANDKITARLSATSGDPPPGELAPATFSFKTKANLDTKDPPAEAQVFVKGAYVRDGDKETGSLQGLWQKMPWTRFERQEPNSARRLEGYLSPLVDILLTSDDGTPGYLNGGVQGQAFVSNLTRILPAFEIRLSPRAETDKRATVANFVYLDAELRVGLAYLFHGYLLGAFYRVMPRAGFERARTFKGDTVTRPELSHPTRRKIGVGAILEWPKPLKPTWLVNAFGFEGFRVDADWRRYQLDDVPSGAERRRDYWTVAGLYKLTPNVGVSLTTRNGDLPPLYQRQKVTELGLAFIY